MKKCPDPKCGAPALTCRWGEDSPQACPVWTKARGNGGTTNVPGNERDCVRLPWTGAALGTAGLAFIAGRADPALVAVIGAHNAGKTTLLGLFYQLIGRTGRLGGRLFAGSYSLEGWEAIAHALRWESNIPRFPPHTSSGSGRAPGLLHMAMRTEEGGISDIFFADSPGEWFQRWAIEPTAADAEGARWVIERASAMMVVADCEALAGPDRGQARSDIIQLMRRVAQERRGRPVALTWTKADIAVPALIRAAVTDTALLVMPDIKVFETSVVPVEQESVTTLPSGSVSAILDWMIAPYTLGFDVPATPPTTADPFFAIGAYP